MNMRSPFLCEVSTFWRKFSRFFLACSIFAGFLFGIVTVSQVSSDLLSWMCTVPRHSVSIIGLLTVIGLPLILSFLTVYSGHDWLFIPICFFQAFSWSYCSCLAISAFGTAGWLVEIPLMFSSSLLMPIQFWFALRYISGEQSLRKSDCIFCLTAALVIGWIDYCLVSPYFAALLAQ